MKFKLKNLFTREYVPPKFCYKCGCKVIPCTWRPHQSSFDPKTGIGTEWYKFGFSCEVSVKDNYLSMYHFEKRIGTKIRTREQANCD